MSDLHLVPDRPLSDTAERDSVEACEHDVLVTVCDGCGLVLGLPEEAE